MTAAFLTGFGTGFSLILAIGAQNAFVLRQGLTGAHIFWICLVCAVSDALLIVLGVAGIGTLGDRLPWLVPALTWGGAAFLAVYGAMALARALHPARLVPADAAAGGLGAALATCLALTWLNPHVYLDTVGLIGTVSLRFEGGCRIAYGTGAALASVVFFFGLGYGARLLAPVFAQARAWAVLDGLIAVVMWTIAVSLVSGAVGAA